MKDLTNDELFAKYKEHQKQMSAIIAQIRDRKITWQVLVEKGMTVQAVVAYRNEKKVTLQEAKKFIDNYEIELIVKNTPSALLSDHLSVK